MLLFRPATLADLMAVEQLANEAPVGMTSLPANREALQHRIKASQQSLAAQVRCYGEESYLFVLEDTRTGEIVGIAGVVAAAGMSEAFYSFRQETLIHASPALAVHNKIAVLSLCHDLTGHTLLTSFYLRPSYATLPLAHLLSRARFLFMANAPARFTDSVVSEMLGVTRDDGSSPFWDAVGEPFFGIDYQQAEMICGIKGRKFIAELMPQHPVYVPLLSAEAQAVIGQVGAPSALPCHVLRAEGFELSPYIDIFDGGPTLLARTDAIHTLQQQRLYPIELLPALPADAKPYLLANVAVAEFRCVLAPAHLTADGIQISADTAQLLQRQAGDELRCIVLESEVQ